MNKDNDIIHYTECEQQPEGFPCICDHIADERREAEIDAQIEDNGLVNEADKDTADTDLL